MRIHIASDHAGFELKGVIVDHLRGRGFDVVDHGAPTFDPQDDYPPVCLECAESVVGEPGSLGVVLGGSGNGEQIAANKVRGARAALAWNEDTARLAREHNDANVVAIGARMHSEEEALHLVDTFVDTRFSEDARHQRRIDLVAAYEERCGSPAPAASAGGPLG